jgi:hypothetical protein
MNAAASVVLAVCIGKNSANIKPVRSLKGDLQAFLFGMHFER